MLSTPSPYKSKRMQCAREEKEEERIARTQNKTKYESKFFAGKNVLLVVTANMELK